MKSCLMLLFFTARNQLFSPTIILVRSFFLILTLLIFNQFWTVVKATNATAIHLTPSWFLWYLLIGLTIQFSRPEGLHKQIEDDIKTGNIAYQMLRPIPIILIYFCRSLGTFLIRCPLLFLIGGSIILFITDFEYPPAVSHLPLILLLMLLSGCFVALCTVFIGLSCLYLQDCVPLFWIMQKCEYVLGGVFFPIIFYPEAFMNFCLATPFAWSIYGVAHLIYDYSPEAVFQTTQYLLFWIFLFSGLVWSLWTILKRKAVIHG